MKNLHRIISLLLLAAVFGLAGTAPAQALMIPSVGVQAPLSTASNPDAGGSGNNGGLGSQRVGRCGAATSVTTMAESKNLVDTRWSGAASGLHSRLDTSVGMGVDVGFDGNSVSRDLIAGSAMSFASGIWNWTTSLVAGSVSFCAPQSVFYKIDQAAGKIGEVVMGGKVNGVATPSLMGLFLAVTFIGAMVVAVRRHSFPLKTVVSKLVAAGMLAVMIAGANGSKLDGNDNYVPGLFSPGWIVTKLSDTINAVGSAPGSVLSTALSATDSDGGEKSWCSGYVGGLHQQYQAEKKSSGSAGWPIPLTMSEMWATTGGKAWSDAQYGVASGEGKFAENAWCAHLDMRKTDPAFTETFNNENQLLVDNAGLKRVWDGSSKAYTSTIAAYKNGSMAFKASTVEDVDASVIAWATCEPDGLAKGGMKALANKDLGHPDSWNIRKGSRADHVVSKDESEAKKVPQSHKIAAAITEQACADWYSGADKDMTAFDWPTNKSDIIKHAENAGALNEFETFVLYLHGEANQASVAASFAYLFSALIMFCVFGLLSVGVFIAQIALVFGSLALILAAVVWAVPFTTQGPKNMMKALKSLMGLSLITLVVVSLFTFITLITRVIHTLGADIGGSVFQSIWTGLSPVIAILVLHLLFTKALKMPSPFTMSGATAWGQTLGGSGGAAGLSGITSLSKRADSMGRDLSARGMERVPGVARGRDMLHRVGAVKTGSRRGAQMAKDPEAKNKATAAAIADALGVEPKDGKGGRRKGAGVPGTSGIPGIPDMNPGAAPDGQGAAARKLNGMINGAQFNEEGELVVEPVQDPADDLKHLAMVDGQDPSAAAAAAAAEIAKLNGLEAASEGDRAKNTDLRADAFEINPGRGATSEQKLAAMQNQEKGRNLLANVHQTDVANSELAEATVGSKNKQIAEKVARIEREQAAKWEKQEQKARQRQMRAGVDPETGEELSKREKPNFRNKVLDAMAAPWKEVRERPVRTIARNVAIGAVAGVTLAAVAPAAVLAAPIAALAPTALNAARRRKNTISVARNARKHLKTAEGQDARVDRYREHLKAEDMRERAERAAITARRLAAEGYQKQAQDAAAAKAAEALKSQEQARSRDSNNSSRGQAATSPVTMAEQQGGGQRQSRRQIVDEQRAQDQQSRGPSPAPAVQETSRPNGERSRARSAEAPVQAAATQPATARQAQSRSQGQPLQDAAQSAPATNSQPGRPQGQQHRQQPAPTKPAQAPREAPRQAPAQAQAPRQAPAQAQAPRQAPAQAQAPRQAPAQAQAPRQAPAQAQAQAPRQAPRPTSASGPNQTNSERRNGPARER